ncbi:MAG: glycoside hydrolase family 10 protein [Bacteroidales bacterium]
MPRFLLAACAVALLLLPARSSERTASAPARRPTEVRALWVTRTTLTSPDSIAGMVKWARDARFNTLLVQVRGRGDAYYRSDLEPRAQALARQPSTFDPLAVVLAEARRAGLRVHAWLSVGLVSSAVELPAAPAHIVHRHPEWLMVPREAATELGSVDPRSPNYLDMLARAVRQSSDAEGLYLSPVDPGASAYVGAVVKELLTRYPVDGVHLDYARYPSDQFDYGAHSLELFADDAGDGEASSTTQKATPERGDLVAWAQTVPDRYREFRRARLTALVQRIRVTARATRPQALVTAAVLPDANDASTRRLQDWRGWVKADLLDAVCPMAYATDLPTLNSELSSARQAAGSLPFWAGIGAYRLSAAQTIDAVTLARRLGSSGVVLFSYDSLVGTPPSGRALSKIGRAVFKD